MDTELNGNQRAPVNIYETTEALVVVAAMPGVMPEDVRVIAEGNVLTLRAELRSVAPKDYLVHEWEYGLYERVLQIPDSHAGPITASYGNGQLAVRIAQAGERPASIAIEPASPLRPD
jgi:HSP20 family protein